MVGEPNFDDLFTQVRQQRTISSLPVGNSFSSWLVEVYGRWPASSWDVRRHHIVTMADITPEQVGRVTRDRELWWDRLGPRGDAKQPTSYCDRRGRKSILRGRGSRARGLAGDRDDHDPALDLSDAG
jgi:hypothetical protein